MYVLFCSEMLGRTMYLYGRWIAIVFVIIDGIAIIVDSSILFWDVVQNLLK